ncbi:P-loop NTPase [Candidatus Woesearchaeota archaeon]|nr:P-loop NTPase [Candidatus Woesearchaeota archaeon]
MKQITVLSGKGGVGKSSIAASLGVVLSKEKKIVCADCDVDASNLALVFGINEKDYKKWEPISTNEKAVFDLDKCISCGKCAQTCYFNAISFNSDKKPELKKFGCEGCGVCELICPVNAISLKKVNNAKIGYGISKYGFPVVSGQLNIGASGSGKVVFQVRELAKKVAEDSEIIINDAAAGIGCPVIASVVGSDFVIAVTEPTPSGFSDLKRALFMVNHFNIRHGIIINKFDLNNEFSKKIEDFARKNNIDVLSKIPYDKAFLKALVKMVPVVSYEQKFEEIFKEIAEKIVRNF